jgi:nitroreductase
MFDVAQIDKLLSTTRAVRKRLDLHRPVERDVVEDCLRLALYAPNATNSQPWRWIVITDPIVRAKIAHIYREAVLPASTRLREQRLANNDVDGLRHSGSILYLAEHLGEVPVHIIPCVQGAVTPETNLAETTALFGSIYPAVWSFQLALRSRGLGSVFTNAHLLRAGDVAEVLGIPDGWLQTCLIPVGYTTGGDFNRAKRRPLEEVLAWDRWAPGLGEGNANVTAEA